jgi:uncharacterized OB-fold protein
MSDSTDRPTPRPGTFVASQPFWEGAKEGALTLQYCKDTEQFQHYPKPVSIYTGSRNLDWRPVTGEGVIYALTTLRVPGPGVTHRLPLKVATVELDAGVRIIGNILGQEAEPKIGDRVTLVWDELGDGTAYPAFRCVERSDAEA